VALRISSLFDETFVELLMKYAISELRVARCFCSRGDDVFVQVLHKTELHTSRVREAGERLQEHISSFHTKVGRLAIHTGQ
jgi:hypothetical protein